MNHKKSVLHIIIFSLLSLIIISCGKNRHEEFGRDLAKVFKSKKYKDFDTTAYYGVFKTQLANRKNDIYNPKWINSLYTTEDKGLTLIGDFLAGGQIDTLINYLQKADEHGFNPDYFHTTELKDLLQKAKNTKFKNVEEAYPILADIELFSADGLINYSNFMTYGAVNPKNIFSRYFVSLDRPDMLDAKNSLDQLNLIEFLEKLQPKNQQYNNLKKLLTVNKQTNNLTIADRERIYFSMERLRWKIKDYPEKYLLVNIPEFKLRMMDNNKEDFEMKVCVGEAKNGESNHETPILSGIINQMQVNPVWNIPKSIATKEILVNLRNDASYLDTHNMVAYKDGELADPFSVDWSTATANDYSFKQNPGADNSLGQIKFIFPNKYAIYLHDTPSKAAFAKTNRAVSHGCVRVEDPAKLAAALVDNEMQANKIAAEIKAAYQGAKATSRWVKVKTPTPVFIEYYTAWTSPDGKLITSDDVYGYDKMLKPKFSRFMAN